MSLLETKVVVEERITIGGKKLNEYLEAVNHAKAIDFIEELVAQKEPLTESVLKQLHYLVLKEIDDESAGQYRNYNVRISGSRHQPPHFSHVQEQINQSFDWYEKHKNTLHPIGLATRFHVQLISIHPFADGNGRTARLVFFARKKCRVLQYINSFIPHKNSIRILAIKGLTWSLCSHDSCAKRPAVTDLANPNRLSWLPLHVKPHCITICIKILHISAL